MNILIPMAGADDIFESKGYTYSKHLIEVEKEPIIYNVINNLKQLKDVKFIFIIKKLDKVKYNFDKILEIMVPDSKIIVVDTKTLGAACTAMLAIDYINNDEELVITNGDQLINVDLNEVIDYFRNKKYKAGTIVFNSLHPRWSFVKVENEQVIEATEKKPISDLATAGFYYFEKGKYFIESSKDMIRKDSNINGLFYVCPVFNEMVLKNHRIGIFKIQSSNYISLALPNDIEEYILKQKENVK